MALGGGGLGLCSIHLIKITNPRLQHKYRAAQYQYESLEWET